MFVHSSVTQYLTLPAVSDIEWPCVEVHNDHTSTVWDVAFETPFPDPDAALQQAFAQAGIDPSALTSSNPPASPEAPPAAETAQPTDSADEKVQPAKEDMTEEERMIEEDKAIAAAKAADAAVPPDPSSVLYHGSTQPRMSMNAPSFLLLDHHLLSI